MARLVDEPDIYAVIVIVPRSDPSHEPVPVTVNGRVAKFIAFMLEHRAHLEQMHRGSVGFDFGPRDYQGNIRESFGHEPAVPSLDFPEPDEKR